METYSKEEIALLQLEAAITLYWEGNYIPSITLSGASEEIFGGLLIDHSKKINIPIPTQLKTEASLFAMLFGIDRIEKFSSTRNLTRNELKHHDKKNALNVEADFNQEALTHIAGAIHNYKLRVGTIPNNSTVKEHCDKIGLS